jgi:5'-methylthioadenosine phosphorylase
MVKIGIIGGSGLDDPRILKDPEEIDMDTPFGKPSSTLTIGKISGVDVVILARHGKKHSLMPTNVPYQANIWALKVAGCTHILATSACGSLRENIKPGDLVLVDQFIDRTTRRKSTFYEEGKVCHIPMAEPFCRRLRDTIWTETEALNLSCHKTGTVVTIEGPRFSSKAESKMYRMWGADVINMSTVPEVVLAREAGICYQVITMSTDYDCWHDSEEPVTIEMVLETMKKNSENVKKLLIRVIPKITNEECECREQIKTAII